MPELTSFLESNFALTVITKRSGLHGSQGQPEKTASDARSSKNDVTHGNVCLYLPENGVTING